jgi:hypothetical protein
VEAEDPRESDAVVDALLDSFRSWSADQRAIDAAARRSKQRWLRQQAGEMATVAGTLLDLCESATPLALRTIGRRTHSGTVVAAGTDVCVLHARPPARVQGAGAAGTGSIVVVALGAIVALRPLAGRRPIEPSPDRVPELRLSMGDVVAILSEDRMPVRLELADGEVVAGELRSVGADVVTLRSPGGSRSTVLVPIEAVCCCLV